MNEDIFQIEVIFKKISRTKIKILRQKDTETENTNINHTILKSFQDFQIHSK